MPGRPGAPEVVAAGDVVLRAHLAADIGALHDAFADPAIATWNPGPRTAADLQEWIERRNDWSAGTHACWAVADATGALLGSVCVHKIDRDQLDAEIGYWVVPSARRRGVASTAVEAATRYAFGVLGLHRVYLFHAVENVASCRVALRAGFRHEGELRQSFRYADGRYHDEHLHARLADDVPA